MSCVRMFAFCSSITTLLPLASVQCMSKMIERARVDFTSTLLTAITRCALSSLSTALRKCDSVSGELKARLNGVSSRNDASLPHGQRVRGTGQASCSPRHCLPAGLQHM